MNRIAALAFFLFSSLAGVGQVYAWELGHKEGGVCVTHQAGSGGGMLEIAYLPSSDYLIKFASPGTIGDKSVGTVSVKRGAEWADFSVKLQVVQDAVLGVSAYSYQGMPAPLLKAIRAGSALKFGGSEFSLAGSTAALKAVVDCVKGKPVAAAATTHLAATVDPHTFDLKRIPAGWSGIYIYADKTGNRWVARQYDGTDKKFRTCKLVDGSFIVCK